MSNGGIDLPTQIGMILDITFDRQSFLKLFSNSVDLLPILYNIIINLITINSLNNESLHLFKFQNYKFDNEMNLFITEFLNLNQLNFLKIYQNPTSLLSILYLVIIQNPMFELYVNRQKKLLHESDQNIKENPALNPQNQLNTNYNDNIDQGNVLKTISELKKYYKFQAKKEKMFKNLTDQTDHIQNDSKISKSDQFNIHQAKNNNFKSYSKIKQDYSINLSLISKISPNFNTDLLKLREVQFNYLKESNNLKQDQIHNQHNFQFKLSDDEINIKGEDVVRSIKTLDTELINLENYLGAMANSINVPDINEIDNSYYDQLDSEYGLIDLDEQSMSCYAHNIDKFENKKLQIDLVKENIEIIEYKFIDKPQVKKIQQVKNYAEEVQNVKFVN